jgi:hypothetical protein
VTAPDAQKRLAWVCSNCDLEERDEAAEVNGYAVGDTEPCVHCHVGNARVVDLNDEETPDA